MRAEASFIEIAGIVRPHGLRGELKLRLYSTGAGSLANGGHCLFSKKSQALGQFEIDRYRPQGSFAIVKFKGIDDRTQAEEYRDCSISVSAECLVPKADDEYYIRDLIGMRVMAENGDALGVLMDVLELPANDVYQIMQGDRELLIPAIADVILSVSVPERLIVVRLPDGLQDPPEV